LVTSHQAEGHGRIVAQICQVEASHFGCLPFNGQWLRTIKHTELSANDARARGAQLNLQLAGDAISVRMLRDRHFVN
jgi:hypothetical protein